MSALGIHFVRLLLTGKGIGVREAQGWGLKYVALSDDWENNCSSQGRKSAGLSEKSCLCFCDATFLIFATAYLFSLGLML